MGYYLLHRPGTVAGDPPDPSETKIEGLRAQLEAGDAAERRQALRQLIALRAEDVLARCLGSVQPEVVRLASNGLWECWLNDAGAPARQRLEEGIEAMNLGDLEAASGIFERLSVEYPHWAEAINKQATVLYLQGEPQQSIEWCRQVVALKPDHFGAWNGMAICAIQIEDWPLALHAVEESLRLQPHSPTNRQLLRLVQTRLPQA